MKMIRPRLLALMAVLTGIHTNGQGFVNLNFESATIVPVSGDEYNRVDFRQAFPGWTGYIGTNATTLALYDNIFLDSSGIGILDSNGPVGFGFVDKHYSAMLEAGLALGTTETADATLSQTALVPAGTQSLRFNAMSEGANMFTVTLNGQALPLIALSSTSSNALYSANIQAWAGQTATLAFTAIAQQPHVNNSILYLDNIQFFPTPIPEPSVLFLSILGGSFLVWRGRTLLVKRF